MSIPAYTFAPGDVVESQKANANWQQMALFLQKAGDTLLGTFYVQHLLASSANLYDLGSATAYMRHLYSKSLRLMDTDGGQYAAVVLNENLSGNKTLNIVLGDANRTITFTGNVTMTGTNTGDETITAGVGANVSNTGHSWTVAVKRLSESAGLTDGTIYFADASDLILVVQFGFVDTPNSKSVIVETAEDVSFSVNVRTVAKQSDPRAVLTSPGSLAVDVSGCTAGGDPVVGSAVVSGSPDFTQNDPALGTLTVPIKHGYYFRITYNNKSGSDTCAINKFTLVNEV